MALITFDGFDGYDSGSDLVNYGGWYACSTTISSTVRIGTGKCLQLDTNQSASWRFSVDQSTKTLIIGFSYKHSITPNANLTIFYLTDSATTVQIQLMLTPSNILQAVLGPGAGTVLATGSEVIANNGYYYIELKIKIANSGGIFDCKLNNVSEFTFSGDTQYAGTDSVQYANFITAGTSGLTGYIDDVYILDTTGSLNNTYLGEQRAELIYPTSDSSVTFTPSTGATNYTLVDDTLGAPDDGTTYVSSSTVGNKDEYGLGDLSNVYACAGVKVVTRAQKDDTGTRTLKTGIKSGATDQQVEHALPQGYVNFIDIFETSDGVSTAFTQTTINSLLSTIEVAS